MKSRNLIRSSVTLIACSMAASTAYAKGGIDTEYADIHITGGAAGGYYASNREVTRQNDQNRLSDFLLGIHAITKEEQVELSGGIGILPSYSLLDDGVDTAGNTTALQYATIAVHPVENLTLEMGRISSNVGYENTQSFLNAHSIGSVQSVAQPGYFPGTRLTYGNDALSAYVEQSDDTYTAPSAASTGHAWAAGAMGEVSGISYVVGYQNYSGLRTLTDVILSGKIMDMDVTFAYDRISLTEAALAAPTDKDHAESIALYFSGPTFDKVAIPFRLERFDDHGNGIYGNANGAGGKGHSITITPTWNFTENAYIRTDFSYLKFENKILTDVNGLEDNRFMFVLQVGYKL
ncbi:MAG: outer membrane beta-barrel protein [Gammaproteobacteria bacterium]|nr:outer membrane beta-barrel protein [Gammaproteobacteria bacterium]